MHFRLLSFVVFVALGGLLFSLSEPVRAQIRDDGAPAAALGVGDAVTGVAVGSTALYFNPAGMSRVQQYAVETGYNFSSDLEGHVFTATAVDSKTNRSLGMGLSYAFVSSLRDGRDRDGSVIRGGLSTGHRTTDFSISAGVGGRYSTLAWGDEDTVENGENDDINYFTLDAGLMAEFSGVFNIGLVGRNLIDTKHVAEAPRSIGVGIGGKFKTFSISADFNADLQSEDEPVFSYGVGAQLLMESMIVLRAGYTGGGLRNTNHISAGISYVSQMVGVDVAFRQGIEESSDTTFSLAMKVFMP